MEMVPQPPAAPADEHTLESLVDDLRDVLRQSLAIHRQLVIECEAEASALREIEVDELRAIIDRKVVLAARTVRLETRREKIVVQLSPHLSLTGTPTLSEIAALLPRTARLDVNHLTEQLTDTIHLITSAASRNRAIAEGGVHIAGHLIASISSIEPSAGSYSGRGRVHPAGQRPIIEITG